MLENFSGQQRREDGSFDHWFADLPFPIRTRASKLTLKQAELDMITPVGAYQARMFLMWEPADHEEYVRICNKAENGASYIKYRDWHWDEAHKNNRIWVEWVEMFGVLPKDLEAIAQSGM